MEKKLVISTFVLLLVSACGQAKITPPTPSIPASLLVASPSAANLLPSTTSLPSLPIQTASPKPTQTPLSPTNTATTAPPPDVNNLVVIDASNTQSLQRLATLTGHTNRVTDLAFSADGSYIASTGWDKKIRLWDLSSMQEVASFPIAEADLNVIAFSPDGSLLASAEAIWDVSSGERINVLNTRPVAPGHIAFSPDGTQLAVAGFHQSIEIWDVNSGSVLRTIDIPAEAVGFFNINYSTDGKSLAAGGAQNGTVTFLDVDTGQVTASFEHGNASDIHDVAISPDGHLLASGGTDYAARIWDIATGEVLFKLHLGNGIYSLAFSPDGALLATAGCDRTVKLWDVESGRMLRSLSHPDELMAVAFSADGKLLAAGGYDFTIVVWGISNIVAGETPGVVSPTDVP